MNCYGRYIQGLVLQQTSSTSLSWILFKEVLKRITQGHYSISFTFRCLLTSSTSTLVTMSIHEAHEAHKHSMLQNRALVIFDCHPPCSTPTPYLISTYRHSNGDVVVYWRLIQGYAVMLSLVDTGFSPGYQLQTKHPLHSRTSDD